MPTILYDAAYAPAAAPAGAVGFLIYIGGDTPNPITTEAQIAAYGHLRYWLPVWVRSNPSQANALLDANQTLQWLIAHNAPPGIAVVLDLETAADFTYVSQYGTVLRSAGFKVWPYGSKSTLFSNPAVDGYFVADPTGVDHLVTGTIATQFYGNGSYDLEDIANTGVLWDTQARKENTMIIYRAPNGAEGTFSGTAMRGIDPAVSAALTTAGVPVVNIPQADFDAIPIESTDPAAAALTAVNALAAQVAGLTTLVQALSTAVGKIPTSQPTSLLANLSGTTATASIAFS